jgi:hypothetical protein
VLISEVLYDPTGPDDAEFIEIVNPTGQPVDLSHFGLLQEIKDPVKRAATSSQFHQYAGIPDHYSLELALLWETPSARAISRMCAASRQGRCFSLEA